MTAVFKCDRTFRVTLADALAERDAKMLRNMLAFAEKQVSTLTRRSELVGPLIDWPALRESWAQDARRLRAAVRQLEKTA